MPAVTTEGLILKRINFGEADRVITVLTDRYGKISVIARGIRKITSRRAGNVEVLNRVKLHLFRAKGYTLQEAESLETFSKLKENLTLTTTAFHIIELVDKLTREEEKNPELYNLVISILQILEKNPRQIFIRAFEIKLLAMQGFWSSRAVADLSPAMEILVEALENYSWRQIEELEINQEQALVLESLLRYYTEKVLESSLKSVTVMNKLKESKNG